RRAHCPYLADVYRRVPHPLLHHCCHSLSWRARTRSRPRKSRTIANMVPPPTGLGQWRGLELVSRAVLLSHVSRPALVLAAEWGGHTWGDRTDRSRAGVRDGSRPRIR